MRPLLLLLALVLPSLASAQVAETFADGEFTTNPTWSGDAERFAVVPFEADFALRSDGLAESDTIALATPSATAFGTWRFRFGFEDNLTTGKGTRVYLLADTDALKGEVQGYYVQIGTNNSDEIRLYRQDGASTARSELGDGLADLVVGDTGDVVVEVTRDGAGLWTVTANPDAAGPSFTATDNTYSVSTHVGIWLKHTSAAGRAFFWDDIEATSSLTDTVPPQVEGVQAESPTALLVEFSEGLSAAPASGFLVDGVTAPTSATIVGFGGSGVRLSFANPFPNGDYTLTVSDVADLAGNLIAPGTEVPFSVALDLEPPTLVSATAIDAQRIALLFDEPIAAPAASAFEVNGGIGIPVAVEPSPGGGTVAWDLVLATPLVDNTAYVVTARGIEDLEGNAQAETSTSFFFGTPAVPSPGEIVVNEVMYDPPAGGSEEYVEVFNRTDRAFDLSQFLLADAAAASRIAETPTFLLPDGFAVLVRDGAAFSAAFPGVLFVEVPSWRALNNSGDDVALLFQPTADDAPVEIDRVPYVTSWGGVDAALERIDPEGSSATASNFATTTDPRGGTPGAQNSVFAPDATPPLLLDAAALSATEVLVRFDEPLDAATAEAPANYTISDGAGRPLTAALAPEGDPSEVLLTLASPLAGPQAYVLTVRNIADSRGNVLAEASQPFFFGEGDTPVPGDLVVNEVMYDPPTDGSGEYVEVFNTTTDKVFDLRDLTLDDASIVPTRVTDAAAFVGPGAYAVVVQDADAFRAAFPDFDATGAPLVTQDRWGTLNNGGDTVVLGALDGETTVVLDSVAYLPSWGGDGVALERKDPAGPSSSRTNFASSTDPSGGTPGALNSVFELDETPPGLLAADALSATELLVRFDEPLDAASAETPANYAVSDGIGTPSSAALAPEGDPTEVLLTLATPLTGPQSYELTVREVSDLRGNAIDLSSVFLFFGEGDVPLPGDLVVNEIMYDPPAGGSGEYVEVFNQTSDKVFDLRTFALDDASVVPTPITDSPVFVEPGGYGVIVQDRSDYIPVFNRRNEVEQAGWGSLNNSGDTVVLSYLGGVAPVVIDSVAYLPSFGGDGVSLERKDPAGPSASPGNFASSIAPAGGTPGEQNSVFERDVTGPQPLEGEVTDDEQRIFIVFDELIDADTVTPDAVTLTAGEAPVPALNQIGVTLGGPTPIVTLGYTDRLPGGDLTLTFTGFRDLLGNETPISTLVIPFVPDRTPPSVTGAEVLTETTVRVTFSETVPAATALDPERYAVSDGVGTPRGVVYASGQIGTAVVLTLETPFEAQRLFTLTVAGLADRSGNLSPAQELLLFFGEPDVPVPGDVVINELMFDPLAGSDGEYVEVLNTTSKTFDLRRFRLTDDGDAEADPISETPLILPPNGLVVLASVPDTVRSVFGEVAGLFEPDDAPGLNNTEDTVVLQTEVEGGVLTIDQVTYSDDWHRPELRETDGIALERIAPDGRSNDAANWSSSLDARGGTPGASNSVFVDPEAPPPGDAGLVIDSPFAPDEGQSSRIAYTLEADAAVVRVRLFDGAGRRVRTLESGDLTGRSGFLDWDGRDDAGRQLRVGIYVVLLEALDAQGGTAEAYKEVVVLARRF